MICPKARATARLRMSPRHPHLSPSAAARSEGAWGYVLEYASSLFWESCSGSGLLTPRLRCHPRLQPAGQHLPDRRLLQTARRQAFYVRSSRYQPRALRGEVRAARPPLPAGALLERLTFMLADVSIATNDSYRHIAVERGKMPPERVFVVRSGPSLERMRIVPPEPALEAWTQVPRRLCRRHGRAGGHPLPSRGRAPHRARSGPGRYPVRTGGRWPRARAECAG